MINKVTSLPGGGKAAVFPEAIVIFNFSEADADAVAEVLTANPVKPVTFLATKFDRTVFSQGETRNRSFVFAEKFIPRTSVDSVYPVQWLAEGDLIPMLPGNIEVTATATGFTVNDVDFE